MTMWGWNVDWGTVERHKAAAYKEGFRDGVLLATGIVALGLIAWWTFK